MMIFGERDWTCSVCGKPRSKKVHGACSKIKQRERLRADEKKALLKVTGKPTAPDKPSLRL